MIRRTIVKLLFVLALAALPVAASNVDFERLVALEGKWVELDEDGKPGDDVVSVWSVTAGGTAVIETLHPGGEYEMVTVYHSSGDKLALTHYCSMGNQPRMEAVADGGTIDFKCAGGDNIPSEDVPHMHALSLRFVDENHVIATWSHHEGGAEDHSMTLDMVRKQ